MSGAGHHLIGRDAAPSARYLVPAMPTYVYKFVDTGETIEVQQSFTDDTLTEYAHPSTGETMTVKKVFLPVGVTFKGDGFYKTDSRAASKASSSGSSSGDSAKESSSSSSESGSGSGSTASGGSSESSTSGSSSGSSSSGSSSGASSTTTASSSSGD